MKHNRDIPSKVRRNMTKVFAADPILKYGCVSLDGCWTLSCGRKERSLSLSELRNARPGEGWFPVSMREWVDWDYYQKLRGEDRP